MSDTTGELLDSIVEQDYVVGRDHKVVCIITTNEGVQEFGLFVQRGLGRFDAEQAKSVAYSKAVDRLKQRLKGA